MRKEERATHTSEAALDDGLELLGDVEVQGPTRHRNHHAAVRADSSSATSNAAGNGQDGVHTGDKSTVGGRGHAAAPPHPSAGRSGGRSPSAQGIVKIANLVPIWKFGSTKHMGIGRKVEGLLPNPLDKLAETCSLHEGKCVPRLDTVGKLEGMASS